VGGVSGRSACAFPFAVRLALGEGKPMPRGRDCLAGWGGLRSVHALGCVPVRWRERAVSRVLCLGEWVDCESTDSALSTFVGGFARQRLVDTSWRLRGDPHTACVATKSPTGATGKMRRTHQRSTWPYRNTATLRICLLAKFNDRLESNCSSYERC